MRKGGRTRPGCPAVTLEPETVSLAFKAVLAESCPNCGEVYAAAEVSAKCSPLPNSPPAPTFGCMSGGSQGLRPKETRPAAGP
jgi:hypothetical protein